MGYVGKKPTAAPLTASDVTDGIISNAKLAQDIISAETALAVAPADTDEFLLSDAGTLKRIDYSLIKGGGQWEFISSTNIADDSSAVDFTTLSTDYDDFLFTIQNLHTEDDGKRLYARVFTGTGGSQAVDTGSNYGYAVYSADNAESFEGANSVDHMRITYVIGNADNESANAEVILYNPHSTTFWKQTRSKASHIDTNGFISVTDTAGSYRSTTAVTGMRFYAQTANIDSGKITLFGRKNS